MSRLSIAVFLGMCVLLVVGGCVASRAEAKPCDTRHCHALQAQAPRELGWYWWPEATR